MTDPTTLHDFRARDWGHGLSGWERINATTAETFGHGLGVRRGDRLLMDWSRAGGPPAVVITVAAVDYLTNPRTMFRAILEDPRAATAAEVAHFTETAAEGPPTPPRWLLPPSGPGGKDAGRGAAKEATAHALQMWLLRGQRGASSNVIAARLTGTKARPIDGISHPRDPGDLRRCFLLCDAVPEFAARIMEVGAVSWEWARLVAHWEILRTLMDEEAPRWRDPASGEHAPRTYTLIRELTALPELSPIGGDNPVDNSKGNPKES